MDWRTYAAAALLVAPSLTVGSSAFTDLHPEEAYPDPQPAALADPYSALVSSVQARLRVLGFDPGPVNGLFSAKTQAALAQFQIASDINASGQLDDPTLAELGVDRRSVDAQVGTGPRPK